MLNTCGTDWGRAHTRGRRQNKKRPEPNWSFPLCLRINGKETIEMQRQNCHFITPCITFWLPYSDKNKCTHLLNYLLLCSTLRTLCGHLHDNGYDERYQNYQKSNNPHGVVVPDISIYSLKTRLPLCCYHEHIKALYQWSQHWHHQQLNRGFTLHLCFKCIIHYLLTNS